MALRLRFREGCLLLTGMMIAYGTMWLSGNTFVKMEEPLVAGFHQGNAISLSESFNFLEEADDQWLLRKAIHGQQMKTQAAHQSDCLECPGHAFWQIHYEPSFSCALERRIGPAGDGGKWLCDPHRILTSAACLVYSIGSNGEYGFEEGMKEIAPHCDIHTFDVQPWAHYTNTSPPAYVSYHQEAIGQRPLGEVFRELGHHGRTIDIFKIDCEGCELTTYRDWFTEDVFIRQILVEVHGPKGFGQDHGPPEIHRFFRFLFDQGYVIFHKEMNTLANTFSEGGNFVEYSLLKLSPEFSSTASH